MMAQAIFSEIQEVALHSHTPRIIHHHPSKHAMNFKLFYQLNYCTQHNRHSSKLTKQLNTCFVRILRKTKTYTYVGQKRFRYHSDSCRFLINEL